MRTTQRLVTATLLAAALLCAGCRNRAAELRLTEARTALEQKRYEQAMVAADEYLKNAPRGNGAAEAHYFRGRALEQRVKRDDAQFLRDLGAAKASYVAAMGSSPSSDLKAYIQTSLGNVAYWLNDYAAAEAAFRAAHELLPAGNLKGWALYRMGLSQQRQGKWTQADETFAAVQNEFAGSEMARRAKQHQGARAFYVQVAAFQNPGNADRLVTTLRQQGLSTQRLPKPERNLHVVMAGPARTYAEALALRGRLNGQFRDALIVP